MYLFFDELSIYLSWFQASYLSFMYVTQLNLIQLTVVFSLEHNYNELNT